MKVSEEFFNQLNPSYQAAIKDLEKKLDKCEKYEGKEVEIMMEFSRSYLMPKEYWHDIMNYLTDVPYDFINEELIYNNALKAYYHFYYDVQRDDLLNPKEDIFEMHKTLKSIFRCEIDDSQDDEYDNDETDICFPHSHLSKMFYRIERESNRALSKTFVNTYKRNKAFYENLKGVKHDVERWFNLLCEIGYKISDEEFIRHNIEYRLGTNLLDIKLWKLYIEYLREYDPKEMLQVYSKYCRFFLDDSGMKEKYKQEVVKYGPIYVQWKNVFDFESAKIEEKKDNGKSAKEEKKSELEISDTESPNAPKNLHLSATESVQDPKSVVDLKSDGAIGTEGLADGMKNEGEEENVEFLSRHFYDTYQHQNFPFKNPFLSYILKNGNGQILTKLHQSCKYFFIQKPTPVCHRLICTYHKDKTHFCEESLEIVDLRDFDLNHFVKNTILSTTFDTRRASDMTVSEIISRLYRCDAKYIDISCNLSADELKFLLQSGNVVIFKWRTLSENKTKLEEITKYLPNIEELFLQSVNVTSQTFRILLNQTFLSKFYSLDLCYIKGEAFDTDEFLNFCIKNRAEYFYLNLHFSYTFPDHNVFTEKLKMKMLLGIKVHDTHANIKIR